MWEAGGAGRTRRQSRPQCNLHSSHRRLTSRPHPQTRSFESSANTTSSQAPFSRHNVSLFNRCTRPSPASGWSSSAVRGDHGHLPEPPGLSFSPTFAVIHERATTDCLHREILHNRACQIPPSAPVCRRREPWCRVRFPDVHDANSHLGTVMLPHSTDVTTRIKPQSHRGRREAMAWTHYMEIRRKRVRAHVSPHSS